MTCALPYRLLQQKLLPSMLPLAMLTPAHPRAALQRSLGHTLS